MDGDGKISTQDLKTAFHSLKRNISSEEVEEWILKRDSTGTGAVNFTDFMANFA